MIKTSKYLSFLIAIVLFIAINGCIKNEICKQANNILDAQLLSLDQASTLVPTKIDSVTMFFVGDENDTVYNNSKNISNIHIPLADTTDFLKVVLKLNDGIDTLWIDYRPYEVFRSTECGVINRYEINEIRYTKNKVWALYLDNNQVDESEEVNILLIFRPN